MTITCARSPAVGIAGAGSSFTASAMLHHGKRLTKARRRVDASLAVGSGRGGARALSGIGCSANGGSPLAVEMRRRSSA